jgi:hypothetical protein
MIASAYTAGAFCMQKIKVPSGQIAHYPVRQIAHYQYGKLPTIG